MKIKLTYLFIFILIFGKVSFGEIVTNRNLLLEVNSWRENINKDKTKKVISQIKQSMSADIVPWKMKVLSGKNWDYKWGYFAWLLMGYSYEREGKLVQAYDSYMNAYGYMPKKVPPREFFADYFHWYISVGDLCKRLGRYQDAEWFLGTAREKIPKNCGLYRKATAKLAAVKTRQGKFESSMQLYNLLFSLKSEHPSFVWSDYIRVLFGVGAYEKGVSAILNGVRQNGISMHANERDIFMRAACRYWHFFHDIEAVEWYEILGNQLENEKLERGKEELFALLINTRMLMEKAYPELLVKFKDDLDSLKERLEKERTNQLSVNSYQLSGKKSLRSKVERSKSRNLNYKNDTKISQLENDINSVLLEAIEMRKQSTWRAAPWENILEKYDTNILSKVIIDDVNALFLVYASLGEVYAKSNRSLLADKWLAKVEQLPDFGNNTERFTDVLLLHGMIFLQGKFKDSEKARNYFDWAEEFIEDNIRQKIKLLNGQAGLAFYKEGSKLRVKELQELVENYGCGVPRSSFERLARDYYRLGDCSKGFSTLVEGVKRTNIKMREGRFDHLIDAMFINRSFHTKEELQILQKIVSTAVLRYPAQLTYAPVHAKLFKAAKLPWFDDHIKLAEIEETQNYSHENLLIVSNIAVSSPSIRAGCLYIKMQSALANSETNFINWTGWLKALKIIHTETKPKRADIPVEVGGLHIGYDKLLKALENNFIRADSNSQLQIKTALEKEFGKMRNKEFNQTVKIFSATQNTNILFDLHFKRMAFLDAPSPPNPSFAKLLEMMENVPKAKQEQLRKLFLRLIKYEKKDRKKDNWQQYLQKVEDILK